MKKVENGSVVSVNYTGKLEDGTIFDTSLQEGRTPIEATIGAKQVIPGFEEGLIGMLVGEKKTVEIEPANAYGEYKSEMIFDVPRAQIQGDVKSGDVLNANSAMGPVRVTVVDVSEDTVKIDANHPLAGKKLIFELEVMEIN